MESERKPPDVYTMTKFATLPSELTKYLPKCVNIISIPVPGLRLNYDKDIEIPEEALELAREAEVIVIDGGCLAHMLYKLPNVKWAQSTWAGIEQVVDAIDPLKPFPSFTLTRYSDSYFGELMSNYVIAQIINMERKMYNFYDSRKAYKWNRPSVLPEFRVLSEITVGILGAGVLGSAVGRLLKKGGCKVIAFATRIRSCHSEDCNEMTTSFAYVMENCDYICNILPSTKDTRGLLDGDVLKVCKKKPVLINIGRGDIIKDATVVKALKEGWISKAVLDVFETEPLPPDSPLWTTPEVYITPHVAAMPKIDGIAKFVATNYSKYINGEPLMNVVNWEKCY